MKTLSELNWFSFPDGFKEQPDFTIWQAIAYILKSTSQNADALNDYVNALGILENEMAIELLEYHDETDQPLIVRRGDDYRQLTHDEYLDTGYKLDTIALTSEDAEEELGLLNRNRLLVIESMLLPQVLYTLLLAEFVNPEISVCSMCLGGDVFASR